MSSTFFGLNIGASALNAYSASVNTVANNISNAKTTGYCRQVTNLEAAGALRNRAYGTLGGGVRAESITQMRNTYYDIKYWTNNSYAGQYEKKIYYMEQIEDLFTDIDTTKGFTTIFKSMFNSLESLKGSSADETIRNQFINNTQSFMEYFNNMSDSLKNLQGDCNQEVRAMVSQINSYSQKIAVLNEKINVLEIHGAYANELRDQRAVLVDELSKLVSVEVEEYEIHNSNYPDMYTGATYYCIKVEGQLLVDGDSYNELECYSRTDKVNQNDIDGLFDIRWKSTGNDFIATSDTMSGQLKAVLNIRDGNNKENFQGTLEKTVGTTAYIKDPNITSVDAMNMPASGKITIGYKEYSYKSFEMIVDTDQNGKSTYTYKFDLTGEDMSSVSGKIGRSASIGNAVDSRGIPYYLGQMNEFLRSFCRKLNDIQLSGSIKTNQVTGGVDANGDPIVDEDNNVYEPMGTFIVSINPDDTENTFTAAGPSENLPGTRNVYSSDNTNGSCYYFMTAENVTVNGKSLKDPNYFATSTQTPINESKAELVDQMLDLQQKTVVYRGAGGDQFLQYITSDISVDAQEADILYSNYNDVAETIDTYRMSVSSVDEDEEALDLIKFQNAYNMASKIISTMSEMFDRLILQTGV